MSDGPASQKMKSSAEASTAATDGDALPTVHVTSKTGDTEMTDAGQLSELIPRSSQRRLSHQSDLYKLFG